MPDNQITENVPDTKILGHDTNCEGSQVVKLLAEFFLEPSLARKFKAQRLWEDQRRSVEGAVL